MATPQYTLSLLIVAKAKMNYGLCYMGYDQSTNKLVRPLYTAEKGKQCWPREDEFFVGETIVFKVIFPYPVQSSLPHRNDDFLVDTVVNRLNPANGLSPTGPTALFQTLSILSFATVEAIFGNGNILEDNSDKFVREGTVCRSAGIYSCKGENIELYDFVYNGQLKRRCIIKETLKPYNLSITAEDSYQQPQSDDSVLLLLGLGRPWVKRGQPEKERRCYIFVIGMITKPSDSNMPQVDQLSAALTTLGVAPRTF